MLHRARFAVPGNTYNECFKTVIFNLVYLVVVLRAQLIVLILTTSEVVPLSLAIIGLLVSDT